MAGTAGIQNSLTVRVDVTGAANVTPDNYTVTRHGFVLDAAVIATAADVGGTLLVGKGATAITNAIICAVANAVSRAATVDATTGPAPFPYELEVGDLLRITANQAGTRGIVNINFQAPLASWGVSPAP